MSTPLNSHTNTIMAKHNTDIWPQVKAAIEAVRNGGAEPEIWVASYTPNPVIVNIRRPDDDG